MTVEQPGNDTRPEIKSFTRDQLDPNKNGFSSAGKKCLIILALSTISKLDEQEYKFVHDRDNAMKRDIESSEAGSGNEGTSTEKQPANTLYYGAYQLESVSKYIIAEQQKRLNNQPTNNIELIILATKATQEPSKGPVIVTGKQIAGVRTQYVIDDGTVNPSASDLFRMRMLEYKDKEYPEVALRFVEESISDNVRQDIPTLLDRVRHEVVAGDEIYIDVHGGLRPTQQLLLNLLSILKEEGIEIQPDHILTAEGRDKEWSIKTAGEGFRINDLVAGIHEFTNYGRMKSLDTFYKNRPNKPTRLLDAMRDVSYAIQVCDMSEFEPALETLSRELTEFKTHGDRDDYLYSFINLLVQGYDPLIREAGDGFIANTDICDEISWCRKKGLYQQMLTLSESRVPQLLAMSPEDDPHKDPVILYPPEVIANGEANHGVYELYNYIFNHTINMMINDIQPSDEIYRANMNGVAVSFALKTPHAKRLINLLKKHFELKGIRNHSAHASMHATATKEDYLRQLSKDYLDLVELFVKHPNRLESNEQSHVCVEIDSLYVEIGDLARHLTSSTEFDPGYDTSLTHPWLKELYRLIGAAVTKEDPHDRRLAIAGYNQSIVRAIYKVWRKNPTNTREYDQWLEAEFLKDPTSKNAKYKKFWKRIGAMLNSCRSNTEFLYTLSASQNH